MPKFLSSKSDTVVVTLAKAECQYLYGLACQRHANNRQKGIKNRRIDPTQSDKDLDYRSIMSEFAVAKYLGLMPNEQTVFDEDCRQGDLRLPGGAYLEVKCPSRRGYRFFIPSSDVQQFTAAVGVLVWPTDNEGTLELIGYTTRKRFQQHARLITPQTSWGEPFVALDNEHLRAITTLKRLVQKRQ